MKSQLPPGVDWLLRLGVPPDQCEPISGDLEEAFLDDSRTRGAWHAAGKAWWQALTISTQFVRERAAHGRGLPPIGDEIVRRPGILESLVQDVRFGVRMLKRQPAFAATAILVLALGTGITITIFSVRSALYRPPTSWTGGRTIAAFLRWRPTPISR